MVIALQGTRATGAGAHRAAVDDVGIHRMHGDEAALTRAGVAAVTQRDRAPLGGTGHRDRGVVLLRAVDAVGVLVVDVEPVELRRLLVVDARPSLAAVERDAGAAVVAFDHAARPQWVDPQVVVVAVRCGHFAEAHTAVGGLPHLQIGDVDGVAVYRVGEDMRVVPGPVHEVAVRRDLRPALAVVVTAVQACLVTFGFDQGPDAAGACARHRDAELAKTPLR